MEENRGIQTKSNRQKHCKGKQYPSDWDYQPGDKVLLQKDGMLHKSESWYESDHWTITSVHMNGTIRVQCRIKSEQLNIGRVTPYFDKTSATVGRIVNKT